MRRALGIAARAAGWTVLGAAACAGLLLAALALLTALPATRPIVAGRAISFLDEAIAGSLVLGGATVLPRGGIELHGLEVYDPDGHLVLSVGRARVFVDVTGLRTRTVGLSVDLESPSVLLEEEEGGGLSISRAFAPTGRRREPAGGPRGGEGSSGWTVHLSRLTVRGGDVWWRDARGGTRVEASGIDVDGRAVIGPGRFRVDARLRGGMAAPVAGPIALDARGGVADGALRVSVLRARLGGTILSAVAEGDVARRTGRIAVTRLEVARDVARALAPRAPEGDDLDAAAYAESDGRTLTLALRAEPAGGGERGRADAAVAARLASPAGALGFDAVLDRLDPSRLVALAPSGEVTLAARGALSGRSLRDLRGRLTASVRRSRLREGELGAAELVARAERGTIEVSRASASAPGLEASGSFRWREGGEVAGRVTADAKDLGRAVSNAGALLGAKLPRLGGRVRVDASLAGTSSAPTATAAIDAPLLEVGAVSFGGARLTADLSGPRASPSARVEGRISQLRGGGGEVAHDLIVRGTLANDAGSLVATAALPGFRDPASIEAHGRLGPGRDTLVVTDLALGYPGSRWRLTGPATLTLSGPSVDALELANGPQRIAVRGGLVGGRTLDARAELEQVDLARIPAGLLPAAHDFRGELGARASARGAPSRPEIEATLSVGGGAIDDLEGLSVTASARWAGPQRRLRASAAVLRAAGGTADVELDLPLPLAGRPAERVLVRLRGRELPVADVLAVASGDVPAGGLASVDAALQGTVGAPTLAAAATLADGEWGDLDRIGLDVAVDDGGEKLTLAVKGALQGRRLVTLDAEAPLDLSALLARPAPALRALRTAPLEGSLAVEGLDLGALAGRAGIPPGLAARIDAKAALAGTLAAPRARAAVDVRGGAWAGYRDLSGRVELVLADAAVSAQGRLALAGEEAVRFEASLRAPVEKLAAAAALRAAPLRLDATVARISLARAASGDVPLTGTIAGRISAAGTLRSPEATVVLTGEGIEIERRPLGSARLDASYRAARTSGTIELASAAGGTLRAAFGLGLDLGLGAARPPAGDAPAEATAVADRLDLGFLAAVAPGTIRTAGGKLTGELRASGPLGRLAPRGTVRVADGRLAVAEWGEWTGIAVEAAVTDDAVEVRHLEVHRGGGQVTATASLRGLRAREGATLEAHLASDSFAIARAGMDIARVDLRADATGSWDGAKLAVDVQIPRGLVRLPRRPPRALQSLEPRKDIVVGKRPERRRRASGPAGGAAGAARPFTLAASVRADKNLLVKSDDPRIDLELKVDVQYERTGSEDYANGSVEVIRGSIEPISGRNFVVERGRVQFTGGPPSAAVLDFQARYDNPAAVVTVAVEGPARSPEVHFKSVPQMDEGEIAMLIATGRADLKAGSSGVSTLTGEEAGKAALGVLATQAFKSLVADKLPVDTVSIDSSGFTAGRYVTDKIYVIYQRRFEADPLRGENTDEVRVEYQISPRWVFESRYGNAQAGGANLIWSREY